MATDHLSALLSGMREKKEYTDLVVRVGKDLKEFNLHKAVVCGQSAYFDRSCSSSFQEAQTGVIELTDVDPVIFAVLVDYMYTGNLKLPALETLHDKEVQSVGTLFPLNYTVLKSNNGNEVENFHNISAQREYVNFSPEEVRLADYETELRGPKASTSRKGPLLEKAPAQVITVGARPNPSLLVSPPATACAPILLGAVSNVTTNSTLASNAFGSARSVTTNHFPGPFSGDFGTEIPPNPPKTSLTSCSKSSNPTATCENILSTLRVYTLADRFLVHGLQRLSLGRYQDAIAAAETDIMWRWVRFGEVVRYVYKDEQSEILKGPLLRLVVKKRAILTFWDSLESLMDEIPTFERGVLITLRQATLAGAAEVLPLRNTGL